MWWNSTTMPPSWRAAPMTLQSNCGIFVLRIDSRYKRWRRLGILFKRFMSGLRGSCPAPSMATSEHTIYARASFARTILVVRAPPVLTQRRFLLVVDPVTSVIPTQDESTYLVMTLDGHIRLMDAITGKLLNDFSGHSHSSYRCRACFGHGEASVVAGDENGAIWAWDLLDAKPLNPNPPPKVHHKVVTWTEHHPTEAGELITASADGTVKVWRYPASGT